MPYPPPAPDATLDPRVFSADAQTFLVGDTIFLRGIEEEDARRAGGWRDSPFPISAERAGELIKERIEHPAPGQIFLVACRRSDGLPVGSLTLGRPDGGERLSGLELYADPTLPGRGNAEAEMLSLIIEWAFGETERPGVFVEIADDQPELLDRAHALGMSHDATWRQHRWRRGRWHDWHGYTAYNSTWVEKLGRPAAGITHAVAADDPSRWRPRQHSLFGDPDGDPPARAVLVGPRVYLRPLELSDAQGMSLGQRAETETFFDEGRAMISVARYRQHIRSLSKEDLPDKVRFAVCLREDDRHIGSVGLWPINHRHRVAETESFFHDVASRNHGYGSEAKGLLLAYAFDTLGLHALHSWVWGPNERSANALRKQGYRECGRLAWAGTKNGQYTHAFCFDLLADEWRAMTANVLRPS
ncbi:MAG TPA: GNAT family protein [Thermomicrobiales bacterium]|jgi:RimJ/RimL family protein N-acetyltransferase|nr:GNAT family protein [Thermomicrobiales bacterium]